MPAVSFRRFRLLPLLVALALLALPGRARARLDPTTWKGVKEAYDRLFQEPGNPKEKADVVSKLVEDGESRSWRMVSDALVQEAKFWVEQELKVQEKVDQIAEVLQKPFAQRYPEDEDHLQAWQATLKILEKRARDEKEILGSLTAAVASGPEVLRKAIYSKARGPVDWPVRAAAARVSAARPGEKISFEFLQRAISSDKDPRVRMAALEALGDSKDEETQSTVESLILGRIADEEWGVQLLAVRIIRERRITDAIPHLINALAKANPRMAAAINAALQDLTGQNFDAYAEVWTKWWEEHKGEFHATERVRGGTNARPPADVKFYGLPIKSDHVVFVIDTSSSMKLETKNKNPAEGYKPPPPVTGENVPAPAPAPEEIMSGPKIDVAKDELKKALRKLPKEAFFNIISFGTAVSQWEKSMMAANAVNKEAAFKWIDALEPSGSTYLDGALRLAFRLAGIGAVDQAYREVNVDTIVVLSDGAPTDNGYPNSKDMDTEEVLQHVREWNAQKRIVVNAIGIDMVESVEFLRKLAEENGGIYVDR